MTSCAKRAPRNAVDENVVVALRLARHDGEHLPRARAFADVENPAPWQLPTTTSARCSRIVPPCVTLCILVDAHDRCGSRAVSVVREVSSVRRHVPVGVARYDRCLVVSVPSFASPVASSVSVALLDSESAGVVTTLFVEPRLLSDLDHLHLALLELLALQVQDDLLCAAAAGGDSDARLLPPHFELEREVLVDSSVHVAEVSVPLPLLRRMLVPYDFHREELLRTHAPVAIVALSNVAKATNDFSPPYQRLVLLAGYLAVARGDDALTLKVRDGPLASARVLHELERQAIHVDVVHSSGRGVRLALPRRRLPRDLDVALLQLLQLDCLLLNKSRRPAAWSASETTSALMHCPFPPIARLQIKVLVLLLSLPTFACPISEKHSSINSPSFFPLLVP